MLSPNIEDFKTGPASQSRVCRLKSNTIPCIGLLPGLKRRAACRGKPLGFVLHFHRSWRLQGAMNFSRKSGHKAYLVWRRIKETIEQKNFINNGVSGYGTSLLSTNSYGRGVEVS